MNITKLLFCWLLYLNAQGIIQTFFCFHRMKAVPPQNVLIVFFPEDVLVRRLQNIWNKFLWAALQTIQVYWIRTHICSYNKYAVCLHALLHTTDLYRMTLDKDGSALLFTFLTVTIFMVFHVKYLSGTISLMTFLSTFLEPYGVFMGSMKEKSYYDFVLALILFSNFKQASFSTDMSFIAMYSVQFKFAAQ